MEKQASKTQQEIELKIVRSEDAEAASAPEMQKNLLYGLNDAPSWQLTILMGLQHFIMMSSGCAFVIILLFKSACVTDSAEQSNIIASAFFVMGICTLVQTTFGVRLPIVEGPSVAFIPAAFTILASFGDECSLSSVTAMSNGSSQIENQTATASAAGAAPWQQRLSTVGGTIAFGSMIQLLIGCSGIMTVLLRFVGPLVLAPTIFMIAISLMDAVVGMCSGHWYIALLTTSLIILFTYVLGNKLVPIPYFSTSKRKIRTARVAIFSSLPILLSVIMTYILCLILTKSNTLPRSRQNWGHMARTDLKSAAVEKAGWFRIPYPMQFGVSVVSFVNLAPVALGVLVSIMESMGDYLTAARLCEAPSPVGFPINRGVAAEGIGCIISGLFGIPLGVTSYSGNVAAISMTRVGSRRIIQATGCILIVFGLFPKLSSLFVCVPEPVIGGVMLPAMGVICGVATSSLSDVRMDRPRNALVFGFSVFFGIALPMYFKREAAENAAAAVVVAANLSTWQSLLKIVRNLLTSELLVGSVSALFLDNLLPGSYEERGMKGWADAGKISAEEAAAQKESYELPMLQRLHAKLPILGKLPIFPSSSAAAAAAAASE